MCSSDLGTDSGSAYVFTRDVAGSLTAGWTQRAKLVASDGAVDDRFGNSVAIDGDVMVVGARRDDDKGSNSGSAYVFELSPALTTLWNASTSDDVLLDVAADAAGGAVALASRNRTAMMWKVNALGTTDWTIAGGVTDSNDPEDYYMGRARSPDSVPPPFKPSASFQTLPMSVRFLFVRATCRLFYRLYSYRR